MSKWQAVSGWIKQQAHEIWYRAEVRQWLLAGVIFAALMGILWANLVPRQYDLKLGQVSPRDIEAPRTIENRYETERLRSEAARAAIQEATADLSNYEIDEAVVRGAEEKLSFVFDKANKLRQTADIPGTQRSPEMVDPTTLEQRVKELQIEIREEVGLEVDKQSLRELMRASPDQFITMEQATKTLAVTALRNNRITAENRDEVISRLEEQVRDYDLSASGRDAVLAVVRTVIRPNLILDAEKIEAIRQEAMEAVPPVMVLQGEIVVRKGDVITREKLQVLKDLGLQKRTANYTRMLGIALVVLIFLALVGAYLWQYHREVIQDEGLLALLGLVVIIVAFVVKVLSLIPWEGTGYLMPVAFGAMLVTLLLDSRLAVMITIALAVVVGLVTSGELKYVAVALVGGITAVLSLGKVSQRSDVTRVGFIVGGANVLTMVAFAFVQEEYFLLKNAYLGLANGIVSAISTIGFLPYLETLFGITSSIKLLELSNPNQPLLRRLLVEAPGTYHHSIIVGNLAEAAAEAVGADGLLARVGAAYHDIGKVKRPYFFVENQLGGENPHDKISPSLSTLIITSHVKDGVELAKKHKLPVVLTDFIRQHHGTDLVKFFYHKAKEAERDDSVEENDFRYPGPKPQSKETAIVMLADSVEAAVRSLSRPTPGRIEGLVRKIIKSRLNDGQLDESDLTLRDLDRVAEAFVQVLSGIFHSRIEYPEQELKAQMQASQNR